MIGRVLQTQQGFLSHQQVFNGALLSVLLLEAAWLSRCPSLQSRFVSQSDVLLRCSLFVDTANSSWTQSDGRAGEYSGSDDGPVVALPPGCSGGFQPGQWGSRGPCLI